MSPRQNVDRPHQIGVGSVATGHAPEDRLRLSVLSIHMPTRGSCPAGVPGIDGDQLAAAPLHLVGELAPELRPALVQDGLVQATLGAHVASGRHSAALGRCAHVPDLQILDDHHGMLRGDLAARVRRRPPQKRCEALVVGGVEERQLGEKALHHRHQVHALEVLKRRVGEKLVKRDLETANSDS